MATETARTTRLCALAELLPDECGDKLHRHHVHPVSYGGDPEGHTVLICERHHPMLESLARRVLGAPRGCPHRPGTHPYPEGREACERRHATLDI